MVMNLFSDALMSCVSTHYYECSRGFRLRIIIIRWLERKNPVLPEKKSHGNREEFSCSIHLATTRPMPCNESARLRLNLWIWNTACVLAAELCERQRDFFVLFPVRVSQRHRYYFDEGETNLSVHSGSSLSSSVSCFGTAMQNKSLLMMNPSFVDSSSGIPVYFERRINRSPKELRPLTTFIEQVRQEEEDEAKECVYLTRPHTFKLPSTS